MEWTEARSSVTHQVLDDSSDSDDDENDNYDENGDYGDKPTQGVPAGNILAWCYDDDSDALHWR